MHMCKTVVYSPYETDGWGLGGLVDLKLIVRKTLQLSAVYQLPCFLSACQFLSLAVLLLFVSFIPISGARLTQNWPTHVQRAAPQRAVWT